MPKLKFYLIFCIIIGCTNKNYKLSEVNNLREISSNYLQTIIENDNNLCDSVDYTKIRFKIMHHKAYDLEDYKLIIFVDNKPIYHGQYTNNINVNIKVCNIASTINVALYQEPADSIYYWSRKDSYIIAGSREIEIELLAEEDIDYSEGIGYEIKLKG